MESSILFAQEGAHVLLVDINLPAVQKVAAIIAERYPNVKAIPIKADVGKELDVKSTVDQAVKTFGRLDIMVYIFFFYNINDIFSSSSYSLTMLVCSSS